MSLKTGVVMDPVESINYKKTRRGTVVGSKTRLVTVLHQAGRAVSREGGHQ